MRFHRHLMLAIGTMLSAGSLEAQNPDFVLTQAQRDSILKDYDNIFPIWGRKVIEKGFEMPKPFGLNVMGLGVNQGIKIDDLGLSTGSNPVVPVDFITFGDNQSKVITANVRAELWVLPFLNVYAIGGSAKANTTVEITAPVAFTTSVDQNGQYAGVGLTGAMGIKRNFAVVDINWAWTKLDKLDEPVNSRVLSLRYGRNLKLKGHKRLGLWLGAMNVKFASETKGSILLSEAIPPETIDQIRNSLENIEDAPFYQDLTPAQKAIVSQLADKLLASDGSDLTVNYQLAKAPSTKWNMLAGANLDLNRSWSLRTEVGFLKRTSLLLGLAYRMDL